MFCAIECRYRCKARRITKCPSRGRAEQQYVTSPRALSNTKAFAIFDSKLGDISVGHANNQIYCSLLHGFHFRFFLLIFINVTR